MFLRFVAQITGNGCVFDCGHGILKQRMDQQQMQNVKCKM